MSDSEKPTNKATPPKGAGNGTGNENGKTGAPEQDQNPQAPEQQDALDVMAALCREYGLDELAPGLLNSSSLFTPPKRDEMQETAFSILQKFLFEGDQAAAPSGPKPSGLDGHIPDPASVLAKSVRSNTAYRPNPQADPQADQQKGSDMNQSSEAASTPSYDSAAAQWRLTTSRPDGGETSLAGAVINDDMFRTAMPHLHGKDSSDADTPDWTIDLAQCPPLASGRTSAQTAISAKLTAVETPSMVHDWSLSVGIKASPPSELATTLPTASPSHLRALLFDTTVTDPAQETYSETARYGGGPYALQLEQSIGAVPSDTLPNLALIRLIFADRPAIPAQLEYIGTLPSPILRGSIPVSASLSIPFWMQITPPGEGDKGAALLILVQYNQETSFNVTAQLLTSSKSCTPTAILSCSGQSDNSACRAASMIANASGRLETTLTGLADAPTQTELAGYGFFLDDSTKGPSTGQKAGGSSKNTPSGTGKPAGASTGKSGGSSTTNKGES